MSARIRSVLPGRAALDRAEHTGAALGWLQFEPGCLEERGIDHQRAAVTADVGAMLERQAP